MINKGNSLVVLCGCPGVGKSSIAGQDSPLVQRLQAQGEMVFVVTPDDFEDAFLLQASDHTFSPELWKAAQVSAYLKAQELLQNNSNCLVFIDDNHHLKSQRRKYFHLAQQENAGFLILFLKCSWELVRERNLNRQRSVPLNVQQKMFEELEPPAPGLSFEQNVVTIDTETDVSGNFVPLNIEAILAAICASCSSPVPASVNAEAILHQQDLSRESCARSFAHQLDLRLRSMVSEIVKRARAHHLPLQPKVVVDERKLFLSHVRALAITRPSSAVPEETEGYFSASFVRQLRSLLLFAPTPDHASGQNTLTEEEEWTAASMRLALQMAEEEFRSSFSLPK
eukprot:GCRY01003344.1.p1 GENE.GCRY01003344.1~~GCRY01003344.1.p1  ORF type:complete len:340 (-),score=58.71 GCRY01003344.1:59-1078(-)